MLEVQGLVAGYDSGPVLHGLSFSVATGTVVAVIGANGAGKSTTLRAMSGLLTPSAGTISVDGRPLRLRSTTAIVRAGVAHVPEGRQVFADLSVEENLMLGAYTAARRATAQRMDRVLDIFPDLRGRLGASAGSLSGGQQQMLAIGRGLMSQPRYLLLDEPSLGLAPLVTNTIFGVIRELRNDGVGILLVEQNGRLALSIADHAFLLEQGSITLSGTGAELLANPNVAERYLGVGAAIGDTTPRHRSLALRLQRALAG